MNRSRRVVLTLLVLALSPFPAVSDTILLRTGVLVTGTIRYQNRAEVQIRTVEGPLLTIPKSQIARIKFDEEPKPGDAPQLQPRIEPGIQRLKNKEDDPKQPEQKKNAEPEATRASAGAAPKYLLVGGGLGAAREETYFQDLKGYQGQANDLLDGAHIIPTSTAQSHTSLSPELEGEAGVGRAYASANIRDTRFHREYENDNFDRNPNGADFIRQARGLSTPISVSEEALRLGYEALETHGIRLGPSAGYTWMQTAQKSHNSGNNYFATGVTIRSVFQFKLSEDYRLRGGTAGLRGQVALPGDITAGADYNRAFVRGDYEFAQRGGAFFNVGTANVSSDSMRFVLHGPVSELRLNLLVPVGSHWYLKPEYTDAFTRIKADVIAWESSVMNSSLGIQENQPSLPNDVFLRSTSFLARGHDHFRSVTVAMVRRIELSR